MKKIYLKNIDGYAVVDDVDFDFLNQFNWRYDTRYIIAWDNRVKPRRKLRLHVEVMGKAPSGMVIDHINHDTKDNRRENLRFVTPYENQVNRAGLQNNNISGESGIHFCNTWKKFVVQICLHGKRYKVGSFRSMKEAIEAKQNFLISRGV